VEWLCVLGFDEVTYASIVVSVQTLTSPVECLLIMFFVSWRRLELFFMMKKEVRECCV